MNERSRSLFKRTVDPVFTESDDEMAAFVGSTNVVTPGELIFDTSIIDGSVRYWCALRECLPQNGEVRKPPTQSDMALRLGITRKSAGTYFNMLRATRWLTVVKIIKHNNLEVGYSYLLHDTRMSLDTVVNYDPTYIDFLISNISAKNKRLSVYCFNLATKLPPRFLSHQQTMKIQNLSIGKNSDEQNLPSGRKIGEQNLPSGGKTGEQNLPSGGKTGEQNLLSGGKTGEQNLPSGRKIGEQNLPSEDIYKTTRARTPTQIGISKGDKDNTTTTSGEGDGGDGGVFNFFQKSEILEEILYDMEHDHTNFGKKTVHALKNCLKRKHYESKDGKPFEWICTEEKAVEMMIALLVDKPNSPLNYLRTLIFADSNDEFLLKPKQRKLLGEYHKRINPDYQEQQHPTKRSETPLERLNYWLNSSNDRREFKPYPLREGQKVKALADLAQFGVGFEAVAVLTLPTWITDLSVRNELIANGLFIEEDEIDRVSNLSLCFSDKNNPMDYETVCKAIELGLLVVEEI